MLAVSTLGYFRVMQTTRPQVHSHHGLTSRIELRIMGNVERLSLNMTLDVDVVVV